MIKDLDFSRCACCGTDAIAELKHASGIVSEVTKHENGEYSVATFALSVLVKGGIRYASESEADARLDDDAKL